jgi:hypothetical protein
MLSCYLEDMMLMDENLSFSGRDATKQSADKHSIQGTKDATKKSADKHSIQGTKEPG